MTAGGHSVLAAGIVVYRPEPGALKALIASLLRQVDRLYLYRNSPLPANLLGCMRAHRKQLQVLGDGRNTGLGVAYNRIVEAAMACGIERILLFDQDSTVPPGLAAELLARMQCLIDAGKLPAAIGPRPIDHEGRPYKVASRCGRAEAAQTGAVVPVQFVISSGSMINAGAFREIGGFREDFFIDAVDVEWCLRARARGFTCWMATDVPMGHRLGAGILRIPLVGVHLVRQPPARIYTFIRNQLALLRLSHPSLRWKAGTAARLVVHTIGQAICARHRLATMESLARGWRDGLLGRLGPP